MKLTDKRVLLAGGGALCVLVGTVTGFSWPLLIELALGTILGASTGLGLILVMPDEKKEALAAIEAMATKTGKVGAQEVATAIHHGTSQLTAIRMAAGRIRAPNTKRRIEKICSIGDKIIEDFKLDPSDIRQARAWLHTYLPQVLDVVTQYANLSITGTQNIEAQKAMANFDSTLDTLEEQFATLLKQLVDNDTRGLEVNNSVLTDMLRNEGISS